MPEAKTYNFEQIGQRADAKDFISAEETALLSAHKTKHPENEKTIIQDVGESRKAQSLGFFRDKASWIHFLTENVRFDVNGTQFSGKVGHQVRGNSIPIAKGVVVDMAPVTLIGNPGGRSAHIDNEHTEEPRVIYYNPQVGKMVELEVDSQAYRDQFELAQDRIWLVSRHEVNIPWKENDTIKADGMVATENALELVAPKGEEKGNAKVGQDEVDLEAAYIDEQGLHVERAPKPTAVPETTPAPETETKPAPETETKPAPETETKPAPETETKPAPETETKPAPETETKPAPETETKPATQTETKPATETETKPATETETKPATETETTPAPKQESWADQLNAVAQQAQDQNMIRMAEGTKYFEDVQSDKQKKEAKKEESKQRVKGDNSQAKEEKDKETEKKAEELKKQGLEPQKEPEPWDYIKAFLTKDNSTVAGKRLEYAKNALKSFFTTGKVEDPTEDEKKAMGLEEEESDPEEKGKRKFFDGLSYPLFVLPGIKGYAKISPDFDFKFEPKFEPIFSFDGVSSFDDLKERVKEDYKETKENDETFSLTGAKATEWALGEIRQLLGLVQFGAKISLGLVGSFGATASLGLQAGYDFLLAADASIYADLTLHGAADSEEIDDALLAASAEKTFVFEAGQNPASFGEIVSSIKDEPAELKFSAGIALSSSVGTKGSIYSKLVGYEKEIWHEVFGEWDLAKIQYASEYTMPSIKETGRFFHFDKKQSVFNVTLFNKEIVKNGKDKYGFNFTRHNDEIVAFLKNQKNNEDSLSKLSDSKFDYAKSTNIEKLKEYLSSLYSIKGENRRLSDEIDRLITLTENDKKYKETLDKQDERKNKHQERVNKLSAYADKKKLSEAAKEQDDKSGSMFKFYQSVIAEEGEMADFKVNVLGKIGVKSDIKAQNIKQARMLIATRENILKYETERQREETEDQQKRVDKIEAEIKGRKIGDPFEFNPDFIKWYKDNDPSKELMSRHTEYADPDALIKYEKSAVKRTGKKHEDRITCLKKKIEELGLSEKPDEGSQKLYEYYVKELDAKELFEHPLDHFLSIDDVIDYEKKVILGGGTNTPAWNTFRAMQRFKKQYDAVDKSDKSEEEKNTAKEEILSKAKKRFFGSDIPDAEDKKLHYSIDDIKEQIQYIATASDLSAYEEKEKQKLILSQSEADKKKDEKTVRFEKLANEIEEIILGTKEVSTEGKKVTDATQSEEIYSLCDTFVKVGNAGYKASANMKEVDKHKGFYSTIMQVQALLKSQKYVKKGELKNVLKTGSKESGEVIRDTTSVESLLLYEKSRIKKYRGQKEKDGKGRKDLDKHIKRADELSREILELDALSEYDRETEIERIKDDYFSGRMDSRLGIDESLEMNKGYVDDVAGNDLVDLVGDSFVDPNVILELLRDSIENDSKVKKHENNIRRIEAQTKKGQSFSEIYATYKKRNIGSKFVDDFKEKQKNLSKDNITMDQLYSFASEKLRAASTKGLGAAISAGIKGLFRVALKREPNTDRMAQLQYGGHLLRYERLTQLKEQMRGKDLTPEEMRAQLIKVYREELRGSNGLQKDIKKTPEIFATPRIILAYEERRKGELTKKHTDRIEMLKAEKDKPEFQGEEGRKKLAMAYRELAKTDGSGVKDKFNSFLAHINRNYRTGADKALDPATTLTPQIILDFERSKLEELGAKHNKRITALSEEGLTDEKAYELYESMGGGKRFFRTHSEEIAQEAKKLNQKEYSRQTGFNSLVKYENDRAEFYEKMRELADTPLKRLKEKKANVEEVKQKTNERIAAIEKRLSELEKTPKEQGKTEKKPSDAVV